jgi:hypothetical protein
MTHSVQQAHIRRSKLKHAVFLLALLTSVSAQAETPNIETQLAGSNGHYAAAYETLSDAQAASVQRADPYQAIKRKYSTRTKSSMARPADTRRAFKEDYERTLVTVGRARSTEMIWLSR